jgi:2-polyprenyl-3-methyl-5-hydroxy-6-metoxy-1,4-benzoquinol methylase
MLGVLRQDAVDSLDEASEGTGMSIEGIQRRKVELVGKFGEWTAHNIHLGGDVYTIGKKIAGDEIKLRRVVQMVRDLSGKPLDQLRVLDLACLEGLYAMEFARHGAQVVAIEGRTANIEKARLAKEALSLTNVELFHDDVRNLTADKYGYFDVVLCLGILYHLDAADVFSFLEHIFQVCKGIAVIDTHVSLSRRKCCAYGGKEYWGSEYWEHKTDSSPRERRESLWASLDNPRSFWFTLPSLLNLLSRIGFTSVYECHVPEESEKPFDRITLVAVRGRREQLLCCPLMNGYPPGEIPEKLRRRHAERLSSLLHKIGLLMPRSLKATAKRIVNARRRR